VASEAGRMRRCSADYNACHTRFKEQALQDPVALSIRQFTQAWQAFARSSASYATRQDDGAEYAFSGLPIPFFNVVVLTARSVSADALRGHARAGSVWATERSVPWFLVVTHDTLEDGVDAGAVLGDLGFTALVPLTGMRADRVAPLAHPPEGLQLTQPSDEAGCAELIGVNSAAYGVSLSAAIDSVGSPHFWKDHFAVVAKLDGKPVSTSAVLMIDGHHYVAFVATDPACQKRGYADAAMRHSLDLAVRAHGPAPTVLHATQAGRPVYERMGYEPISSHTMFIESRFLEGH
jgi:GNAT superfamily N-acetyltransferase